MHAMIIAIPYMIVYDHTEKTSTASLDRSKLEMSVCFEDTVTTLRTLSLCVMMSSVDTLTEHQPLCEYYSTAQKIT